MAFEARTGLLIFSAQPVTPGEPVSRGLTAEHDQLVAKQQDLGILGDVVHPMDVGELDDATDQTTKQVSAMARQDHPAVFVPG